MHLYNHVYNALYVQRSLVDRFVTEADARDDGPIIDVLTRFAIYI